MSLGSFIMVMYFAADSCLALNHTFYVCSQGTPRLGRKTSPSPTRKGHVWLESF